MPAFEDKELTARIEQEKALTKGFVVAEYDVMSWDADTVKMSLVSRTEFADQMHKLQQLAGVSAAELTAAFAGMAKAVGEAAAAFDLTCQAVQHDAQGPVARPEAKLV